MDSTDDHTTVNLFLTRGVTENSTQKSALNLSLFPHSRAGTEYPYGKRAFFRARENISTQTIRDKNTHARKFHALLTAGAICAGDEKNKKLVPTV